MISVSKKTVSKLGKILLIFFAIYIFGFFCYKTIMYYKISFEKDELSISLQKKIAETNSVKKEVELSRNKITNLEKKYITKEELEIKVKDIFSRMSVLDYTLNYLDSKKMCIDRYIIVVQATAQSENGLKAAEGILSYIGNIKKSEKNDTIYFVDYISKPKEIN